MSSKWEEYNLLESIVFEIGGENAVKVVALLDPIEETTDEAIAAGTEMKMNAVRKVLYLLYDARLAVFRRIRDKSTGWFIYFWRLKSNRIEELVINRKKSLYLKFKILLDIESNNEYYWCNSKNCKRILYQEAKENNFICLECNKELKLHDNLELLKKINIYLFNLKESLKESGVDVKEIDNNDTFDVEYLNDNLLYQLLETIENSDIQIPAMIQKDRMIESISIIKYNKNIVERLREMEKLRKMYGDEVIELCVELMYSDENSEIRKKAIEILMDYNKDDDILESAENVLLSESNTEIRESLLNLVINFKSEKSFEFLKNSIEIEKNKKLRIQIISGIEEIGKERSVSIITELIEKDPSWQIRFKGCDLLSKYSNSTSINTLVNSLKDDDARVRRKAAQSLGHMGQSAESAIETFKSVIKIENNKRVKFILARELANIEGKKGIGTATIQEMKANGELEPWQLDAFESLCLELNIEARVIDVSTKITILESLSDDLSKKIALSIDDSTRPLIQQMNNEFSDLKSEMSKLSSDVRASNEQTERFTEVLDPETIKDFTKKQIFERKSFEKQFKSMKPLLERYHNDLERIWKNIPFEKSIFIMMPFRFDDLIYKQIRDAIKTASHDLGYSAFLSNDKYRRFRPGLWENIIVNMLSCMYGIAVLPSEKILDPLDDHKLRVFTNANVALEYGFMYAKGESNVLLLASQISTLPTDLKGLLVEKFNIKDPYNDIYNKVTEWLKSKIEED